MQSADSLRSKPIGRDRLGYSYWMTQDRDCNLRIYQEHLDEDTWQVVATNREEFVNLIARLRANEVVLPSSNIGVVDEDTSSSNSCPEMHEKPPPPEERDDSQEDEQKVPKLSIKLINGKSPKERESIDMGKGEEELALEEDEKRPKPSNKDSESCDEEFEEVEEEYEEEEDDDDETNEEDDRIESESVEPLKCEKTVKVCVAKLFNIKTQIHMYMISRFCCSPYSYHKIRLKVSHLHRTLFPERDLWTMSEKNHQVIMRKVTRLFPEKNLSPACLTLKCKTN